VVWPRADSNREDSLLVFCFESADYSLLRSLLAE